MVKIAIIGEYSPQFAPHAATNAAIAHVRDTLELPVEKEWISTRDLEVASLSRYAGLWIAPGSPYRDLRRALDAIRYAREMGRPCLGTCGGFQHMVLEYARNVLGFEDAHHAEYDPYASNLFISRAPCSLAGRAMQIRLAPGSLVAGIYGSTLASEDYYCNFVVNPDVVPQLKASGLAIVGSDDEGEVRVVELRDHPFFIGTLYVPQLRSEHARPHPLVSAFVSAAAKATVASSAQ